ncbi:MAG: isopenicillin N synthase family oxygenase [Acidimicrobiia bacterium]|nr:isopenicillin N synthase family oxygenase [Acidimicrobiia bacterium]
MLAEEPSTRHPEGTAIDSACREIGFFLITGHGINPAASKAVDRAARKLFHAPETVRRNAACRHRSEPRGYRGPGTIATASSVGLDTPKDLVEIFTIGRVDDAPTLRTLSELPFGARFYLRNIWPDLDGFRHAWERYYREMSDLSHRLLAVLATMLGQDPRYFAAAHRNHASTLVANYYPPVDEHAENPAATRRGEHTDFGTITILTTDGVTGLEVKTRTGQWLPGRERGRSPRNVDRRRVHLLVPPGRDRGTHQGAPVVAVLPQPAVGRVGRADRGRE